jgi:hypothetical protein
MGKDLIKYSFIPPVAGTPETSLTGSKIIFIS